MQRGSSLGAQRGQHVIKRDRPAVAETRRRTPRPILRTGAPDLAAPTPATVLVADDNPATRAFVRGALEIEGYRVVEADGGGAAIEVCDQDPPDLIIIDLCMSDMRGTDVIRRLRASTATAALPIIVFTGAPEEADADGDASFSDLLAKPVDAASLVETVRSHLAGPEPELPTAHPRPRVLLVDAESARALRMRLHLRRFGFDVMLVSTASQALRSVAAFQPAMVVADLVLPDTTALELTRSLRSQPELSGVPVILTSSAPWSEVQARLAARAGANSFVSLGSDLSMLRQAVMAAADAGIATAPPVADDNDGATDHLLRELHEQYRHQVDGGRARERGQAELTVLQGLAEALADTADLDDVLHRALSHCLHAIGASRGAVFLSEIDDGFTMRAHLGDLGRLPGARVPASDELFRRATTTGETIVVDNLAGEQDVPEDDDASPRSSTVVTPLAGGADHYGVLVVEVPAHEDLAYWRHFLKLVAVALGFAVANVRRGTTALPASPARRSLADASDELTGLASATALDRCLATAVDRPGARGCLIVLDVDRIRHVNDALGHQTGDELLRGVARSLESSVGPGVTVARLHSDAYAVLDPQAAGIEQATALARRVLAALDAPIRCNGYTLYATASAGVALFPDHANRGATLLQHATTALDVAKERGGNGYEVYARHRSDTVWQRLALDQGLRAALERDQFMLHYQPIVNLQSGTVSAAEALLRWDRPVHGLTAAASFIQVAEETGLIVPIGDWVIRNAARQVRAWADSGVTLERLAVNVGAREFHDGQIADTVAAAIRETQIDPGQLSLEITETVALADVDRAVATLHRVRDLGVHVALDDFGSGYSSLRYIQKLPIDTLKIDRAFVADASANSRGEPILAGIVELAHRLGMTVVAEGIETERCLELVRNLGCDEAQGYHLGRPGPSEDLEAALVGR